MLNHRGPDAQEQAGLSCGGNILVDPKEVRRIIGGFDPGQALIVGAVTGPNAGLALVLKVVDVGARQGERTHCLGKRADPGDMWVLWSSRPDCCCEHNIVLATIEI